MELDGVRGTRCLGLSGCVKPMYNVSLSLGLVGLKSKI